MGLENFRKNLRYLRRKAGFSQPQIAEICNKKSYTTIQKWETGDAEPSLKDVIKLAEMYGVNIDSLVKTDLEREIHINKQFTISAEDLNRYRRLNTDGQEKVSIYICDLVENPRYTEAIPEPATKEKIGSA